VRSANWPFSRCLASACFRISYRSFAVSGREALAADGLCDPVVDNALQQQQRIGEQVMVPRKSRPITIGQEQGSRRAVERQRLLELVQQVELVAALAVELVDKGDDRHVVQPAHREELAGLLLDAPWRLWGRRRAPSRHCRPRSAWDRCLR
jgi:hypothetical protein